MQTGRHHHSAVRGHGIVTPGGWIAEHPDPAAALYRARCSCGWIGDQRPDRITARADLLIHLADQHDEPL
jgi:hypothetical protein